MTKCPEKVGHLCLRFGHLRLTDTNFAEIWGKFTVKRRQFLARSLAGGSLGYAFNADVTALPGGTSNQNAPAAKEGYARFEELNGALDRDAMQRGWATRVDPSYHHAPQAAIEDFKDRKFGIRIHWGLYCMIGSDASWALAGANQQFWDIYNVFYQFFNPTSFDADAWMDLFAASGHQVFHLHHQAP